MSITKNTKKIFAVTDGNDYSIKEITEWFRFYQLYKPFELLVLNTSKQNLIIKYATISKKPDVLCEISDSGQTFYLSDLIAIFFRQTRLNIQDHTNIKSNSGSFADIKSRFSNYLMAYEETTRCFFLNCLSKLNIIGYDNGSIINKLEVLVQAENVGLRIPESHLVSSKKDLHVVLKKNDEQLITKSVAIGLSFFDLNKNASFHQFTAKVDFNTIKRIPSSFAPSFVQKSYDKLFEIRTFILDSNCYSWALMSQSNNQTEIDYRNYDWDNPMRVVPYQLPKSIEKKIYRLMSNLKLRSGSIDFIYTTKGEYIFLEINPAGQYGYNADCANTDLDNLIAQTLINSNEKKQHRVSHF